MATVASTVKSHKKVNENDDGKSESTTLNKEGAWAAVCFAVVLVAVGLPVWWHTTTVYRAPLPYSVIESLSGLKRQHYVPIFVLAETFAQAEVISEKLQKQLQLEKGSLKFHVSPITPRQQQTISLHNSESLSSLKRALQQTLLLHTASLTIAVLNPDRTKVLMTEGQSVHVTRDRLIIVAADADIGLVRDVVREVTLEQPTTQAGGAALTPASTASAAVPPLASPLTHKVVSEGSYSLTITLMLPQPHRTLPQWDSKAAVEAYLTPLLRQLASLHMHVSVRCQRLYMTPLSGVSPEWQERWQHYALPHTHLPLAINAIEAKLGSFVSTDPALHFIVYVPTTEQTPLHIHTAEDTPLPSNSFVVPRWGGVIIHNPPETNNDLNDIDHNKINEDRSRSSGYNINRFKLDTHMVMSTIITQLHTLLPIPHTKDRPSVSVEEPDSPELAGWQVDGLARARVTQYYETTSTTLQSLCELVGEISNMVVGEEVAGRVWRSVQEWQDCGEATQEGRLQDASKYCTDAHANAHAAFFHPSMLALLYFPDNQKYAIYVPLFLPVSIPVLLSFRTLLALARSYWSPRPRSV